MIRYPVVMATHNSDKQPRKSKSWNCIDCGAEVGRGVKRCKPCRKVERTTRPTYIRTPETNAKISASVKGKPKPWLKGKKRPDHAAKMKAVWADPGMRAAAKARGDANAANPEWRRKIAESVSGDKNPRWLGGMHTSGYAPGFDDALKLRIRTRDKFRCTLCGVPEEVLGYSLSIHHSDYDKSNHNPSNLFATCKGCNSRVNVNREIWSAYFAAVHLMRSQLGKHIYDLIGRQIVTQKEGFAIIRVGDGPDLSDTVFADVLADLSRGVT